MNNFKIVYCFCCCFFFEALSSNELRAYNELFTKIQTLNSILTMSTSMSIIIDNQNKTTTFAEALRLKTTRNTFTVNVLWLALVFQHISFSQYVELNWSVIDDHESIWFWSLVIYLFIWISMKIGGCVFVRRMLKISNSSNILQSCDNLKVL